MTVELSYFGGRPQYTFWYEKNGSVFNDSRRTWVGVVEFARELKLKTFRLVRVWKNGETTTLEIDVVADAEFPAEKIEKAPRDK